MDKSQQFFVALNGVLRANGRNEIKEAIGDSTNNNRTLTVSQVIRFLNTGRSRSFKTLASNLSAAYSALRPVISAVRSGRSQRTDAIDVTEFTGVFATSYVLSERFRRSLGRRLSR